MKTKTAITFLLFVMCCVSCCAGFKNKQKKPIFRGKDQDNILDVSDFSVYYDLNTNQTIRNMMPRPWYKPGWLLRLPFSGGRCKCEGVQCSCCTGIRISSINFDRTTCAILSFNPSESMINVEIRMQNVTTFKQDYSVANPPPLCVPIPITGLPPGLWIIDMCFRLFDVNLVNQKLHVCMDIDTRVDTAPVLVLHFDCMDMGLDGIGLSKPGGSDITQMAPIETTEPDEPTQLDFDVFDPVSEKKTTTETPFLNTVKYI